MGPIVTPGSPSSSASLSSSDESSTHSPTHSLSQSTGTDPQSNEMITAGTERIKSPRHVPPGLFNMGNTCYLNSVVQVLYHTTRFREGLLSFRPAHHRSHSRDFCCRLVTALKDVFENMTRAQGGKNSSRGDAHSRLDTEDTSREGVDYVAPSPIINLLREEEFCEGFDARGQQDAHEFLRFLLDKVNDCMVKEKTFLQESGAASNQACEEQSERTKQHETVRESHKEVPEMRVHAPIKVSGTGKGGKRGTVRSASSLSGNAEPAPKRRRSETGIVHVHGQSEAASPSSGTRTEHRNEQREMFNVVEDMFQGRAVTATRCYECETQSERKEQFLDVSLPVAQGKCLSWALSTECVEEKLTGSNKYLCDTCKTYTEAKRWWQLSSVPHVLTVHLKLFSYGANLNTGAKVPVAMSCPMQTKLKDWCSSDCSQRNDQYRLTGVIVHEGSGASSGHYYSFVWDEQKGWFCCDDSFVVRVSEEDVKQRLFTGTKTRRTAYVLFYSNIGAE